MNLFTEKTLPFTIFIGLLVVGICTLYPFLAAENQTLQGGRAYFISRKSGSKSQVPGSSSTTSLPATGSAEGGCLSDSFLCGPWLDWYPKLHKAIRSGVREDGTPMPEAERKYIIYVCDRSYWLPACGGFGDRMLGIMAAGFFGIMSRRAVIISWVSAEGLMAPAAVDWRDGPDVNLKNIAKLPQEFIDQPSGLKRVEVSKDVVWLCLLNLPGAWWLSFNLQSVLDNFGDAKYVLFTSNRGMYAALGQDERAKRMGLDSNHAVGCVGRMMFKPQEEVAKMMAPYVPQITAPGTQPFCIHLRMGDRLLSTENEGRGDHMSGLDSETRLSGKAHELIECTERVEKVYKRPGLEPVWFVMSDSNNTKWKLKHWYPNKVVITHFRPAHPDIGAGQFEELEDLKPNVAEWFLCALAEHFVISKSGFGKTSAMYSRKMVTIHQAPNRDFADRNEDVRMEAQELDSFCDPSTSVSMNDLNSWSGLRK